MFKIKKIFKFNHYKSN